MKSHNITSFLFSLLILLIIGLVYSPVRNHSFLNIDDNVFVTANPNVVLGLTWDNIKWAFREPYAGQWQPITWISHMIDIEFYGLWAGGHHLTNAIIHALSVLILFFILLRIRTKHLVAFLLCLLWGLHPLRLESVAWVAERKDVLSIFFGLSGLLIYLTQLRSQILKLTLVTCCYTLGLLCKPIIITFPLLLIILDLSILARFENWKKLIIEKLPLFLIAIISALITISAQQADQSLNSLSGLTIQDRLEISTTAILAYLAKFFWPVGGGIFYPVVDYPPGVGEGALLVLGILLSISIKNYQKHPYYLLSLAWLIISSLPIIGIMHIGGQSLADRWTYFPHVGLTLALALYLNRWPKLNYYQLVFFVILTTIYAFLSISQLPNWKNNQSIYSYTLKISPNNFMAHTNLGAAYDADGRLDLATTHFEEAARLNPTYPEALNNLGSLRARQGKINEAISLFEKTLIIRPNFINAQKNLTLARTLKTE